MEQVASSLLINKQCVALKLKAVCSNRDECQL